MSEYTKETAIKNMIYGQDQLDMRDNRWFYQNGCFWAFKNHWTKPEIADINDAPVMSWKPFTAVPDYRPYENALEVVKDNTGMVRRKTWAKGMFTMTIKTSPDKVRIDDSFFMYNDALEKLEWLHKDGSTSPFGVKEGDA